METTKRLAINWEGDPPRILAQVASAIDAQNRELIARIGAADFDPARELDNARNNASYHLNNFFAALKLFRQGEVPTACTDAMVKSTDELLDRLRKARTGLAWTQIVERMARESAYTARMRGRRKETWVRYAKEI